MHRRLPALLIVLIAFLAALPGQGNAAATGTGQGPFEGAIDLKLTMESGAGDLRLWMAGESARLDMALTVNPLPAPIRMTVLLDAKDPRKAVLVNDAMRAYSEIDLGGAAADTSGGKYELKVIGKEKVLGYACTHLTLTRPKELVDAWITQELPDAFRVLRKLQQANPQYGAADAFRALEAAGKAGLPMRCIVVRDGQRVTTEVRKIERRTVPASWFAVPAGYAKSDLAGAGAAQPTPEQVEQMKKLIQGALEGR